MSLLLVLGLLFAWMLASAAIFGLVLLLARWLGIPRKRREREGP